MSFRRKRIGRLFVFLSTLFIVFLSSLIFVGCSVNKGNVTDNDDNQTVINNDENGKTFTAVNTQVLSDISCFNEKGSFGVKLLQDADFHTELQKAYLNDPDVGSVTKYAVGEAELSYPDAIVLEWNFTPNDTKISLIDYQIVISEKEDLSDGKTYTIKTSSLSIYNLKIRTTYYYNITANYKPNIKFISKTVSFNTTSVGPRNLYIDGVSNSRDIGGVVTEDGGIVRQGLIYRTARLNQGYIPYIKREITAKGMDVMVNDLGVKTEIDLRGAKGSYSRPERGGLTDTSVLGTGVNYAFIPMRCNEILDLLRGSNESIVDVFEILADRSNYPVFYHCYIGTDRTGMLTILISGLLGISEDDLYRDYLFSNFSNIGGIRIPDYISSYMDYLHTFEGDSFADKIYNYLISIGVPAENLHSCIEIMKEGGHLPNTKVVNIGVDEMVASDDTILSNKKQKFAPDTYYLLSDNAFVNVGVSVDEISTVDIYAYISTQTSSENIDSAIAVYIDDVLVTLPLTTFAEIGFCDNDVDSTWIPVYLTTMQLSAGTHSIKLASIGTKSCNLASITVVSHDGNVLSQS